MRNIASEIGMEQVKAVVHDFYARVRAHSALATAFAKVADWSAHEEHLTHFWWVTLGGQRYLDYRYDVATRHAEAGFTPDLLVDWLALFRTTLDDHIAAELAEGWLQRAERIAESLRLMHELGHIPARPKLDIAAIPH
ncbi:group III truncated hemoglobin [Chitinimonas sp.]|uniref:group III truncated hemoglobin n=1 Tax=Chitinimonas sp. TaxID=1934313 RepID=UPI002F92C78A